MLIDNRARDLRAGFDEISRAEISLRSEWRSRLLAAYTRQRRQYDAARQAYEQRRAQNKNFVLIGFSMVIVLPIAGVILLLTWTTLGGDTTQLWGVLTCCGLPLTCVVTLGLAGFAWRGFFRLPAPKQPQNPLKSDLLSLLPRWWDGLKGELPSIPKDDGAVGERRFMQAIHNGFSGSYFVVHRLQQRASEDVDVIVVGPKGVWVFEVKYWSGRIMWQDGRWQRLKTYRETGGRLATELRPVSQPPDQQWLRVKNDVARTIESRAPKEAARIVKDYQIGGGVVFTHPDASYKIGPGCPVACGNIHDWTNQLTLAKEIPGWNQHIALGILDGLLEWHHRVTQGESRSMVSHAKWVIQQSEASLQKWVDSAA